MPRNHGLVYVMELVTAQMAHAESLVREDLLRVPTDADTERALRLLRKARALVFGAQRSLRRSVGDADV